MRIRKIRLAVTVGLAPLLLGGLTVPATALSERASVVSRHGAVPGVAPAGADASAVYLDRAGHEMDMRSSGDSRALRKAAALGCTPVSGRDNPHRSGTGVAASGHGWWKKGSCSSDRAEVSNCLYEWYTDNTWRQQACSGTKTLKPGGGSTSRTAARRECRGTQRTSWRNHVEVDVIGELDTGEKPMSQAEVDCRMY